MSAKTGNDVPTTNIDITKDKAIQGAEKQNKSANETKADTNDIKTNPEDKSNPCVLKRSANGIEGKFHMKALEKHQKVTLLKIGEKRNASTAANLEYDVTNANRSNEDKIRQSSGLLWKS